MRLRRAVILVPFLQPADAVSNDVIGMRAALEDEGVEVEILADSSVRLRGVRARALRERGAAIPSGRESLLIYHHSTGWDAGLRAYDEARCPRIVKYHNVTPARYFAPYSEAHFQACRLGREQLAKLAALPAAGWLGDSAYNTRELVELGADARRSWAVPPFHQIEEQPLLEADLPTLRRLRDESLNVLFVGRIAPNKGHFHLLSVVAGLRVVSTAPVRLCLVGSHDPRLDGYRLRLQRAIERAGLEPHVLIAESVSPAVLRAFYLAANVFLCMSEHEGFCVPLAESMHAALPIVAYRGAAVGGTIGDAALGWPTLDYRLYVESLRALVETPELGGELGRRGRARYQGHFAAPVVREAFLRVVDAAADGGLA